MELYYLMTSSFALFLEKSLVIFDYYKNVTESPQKNVTGGVVSEEDLLKKETVYVFSSHIHPDHFNPVIFNWQDVNKNTRYFLDNAIKSRHKNNINACYMKKGDAVKSKGIAVRAYGSTDAGVSFYLETEGLKIFHAGDLNLWHWREESSHSYIERARRSFYFEMEEIEKNLKNIDIAFFPVDPAMGKDYDEGAVYFIEQIRPKVFVPMHCRGDLKHLDGFKRKMSGCGTKVLSYHERGKKLDLQGTF